MLDVSCRIGPLPLIGNQNKRSPHPCMYGQICWIQFLGYLVERDVEMIQGIDGAFISETTLSHLQFFFR